MAPQLKEVRSENKTIPTSKEAEELPDFAEPEDSQMEDQSPETMEENAGIEADAQKPANKMKKGQSHAPALMSLAGSPAKDGLLAPIEQQKLNASKVYTKRHYLYNELG